MSQDKEIILKEYRQGTVIHFFSTSFDSSTSGDTFLAYILRDQNNVPTELHPLNDSNYLYNRNNRNNFEIINIPSNAIVGRASKQVIEQKLREERKNKIRLSFIEKIQNASGSTYTSWVFFKEQIIDDYFAEIKIERTYDVLDTLNVRNNLLGTIPNQTSSTGVLFGRLEARQRINDVNGDKILIPLPNVPVGIFNASDEIPTITSVDENGDRIRLNYKENSNEKQYFNRESYLLDVGDKTLNNDGFLKEDRANVNIPDKFKYTTTTNENGEFILTNIPVGEQVFMFEVDLLKQGLTKDEVSLNFFPYPTEESANVDNVPHFFFRQIPVTIVPTWGNFQTGYTELKATVNLDLRKWTTYVFPPVSVFGQKLEQAVVKSSSNRLKIEVRDMTLPGFPLKSLTTAQITNDLDREDNQQYSWFNEYRQSKRKLEYISFGCNVLKLPGNLYDPNGFKTDKDGNLTNLKGVWISSYQFYVYVDEDSSTRRTGAIRDNTTNANNQTISYTLSHFDINYSSSAKKETKSTSTIGEFPYERAWTIDYPEKYSIPKKPTKERIKTATDRLLYGTSTNLYYVEEPMFEDGDLIGKQIDTVSEPCGGIGVQNVIGTETWFGNRMSQVATSSYIYKYESGVAWNEKYSNGYEPYWDASSGQLFGGLSKVINGEKYQRLECGYGYFMKPEGWPRIVRRYSNNTDFSDVPFFPDYITGIGLRSYGDSENPGPGVTVKNTNFGYELVSIYDHNNDIYNLDNQNFSLALDNRNGIKNGVIDIYRIIDSNPSTLLTPKNFVIPTGIRLNFNPPPEPNNYRWQITNSGSVTAKIKNTLNGEIYYSTPLGFVRANQGETFELGVGQIMTTSSQPGPTQGGFFMFGDWPVLNALYNASIVLPGNTNYNQLTNKYDTASYSIEVAYSGGEHGWTVGTSTALSTKTIPDNFYVKTRHYQSSGKGKDFSLIAFITDGIGRTLGTDRPYDMQTGDEVRNLVVETTPGSRAE